MALQAIRATQDLLNPLLAVDVAAWGSEMAATSEMLAARMEVNPDGNFAAIESKTGRMAGSVWTLCVPEERAFATWMEATGDGFYRGVHTPEGNVVFGANISVDRSVASDEPVGPFLLRHVVETAIARAGRRYGRLGARMPGFHSWSRLFRATDYIRLFRCRERVLYQDPVSLVIHNGGTIADLFRARADCAGFMKPSEWPRAAWDNGLTPFDFELAFFSSVAIRGRSFRVVRLLPGYFPDPESCDNGVLMEWRNPDFG